MLKVIIMNDVDEILCLNANMYVQFNNRCMNKYNIDMVRVHASMMCVCVCVCVRACVRACVCVCVFVIVRVSFEITDNVIMSSSVQIQVGGIIKYQIYTCDSADADVWMVVLCWFKGMHYIG